MTQTDQAWDVVIVGGGPAGIGTAYAFTHFGNPRVTVLERHEVGASFARWPAEMRFITPSFNSNQFGWLDMNSFGLRISPAQHPGKEHPKRPERVVGTGLFSLDRARRMSGWATGLRGEKLPETEEYGIVSFVYRARRPFHPERLSAQLEQDWPGDLRVKGFLWLANRMNEVCFWQHAGRMCHTGKTGRWWASVPREKWPTSERAQKRIADNWQEPYGDRRQELVFIGVGLDEDTARRALDVCLLTDDEMGGGEAAWASLPDPFAEWDAS